MTPGKRFRDALAKESPLQIAGAINTYCALLAEHSGFQALYLSGAGVANASFGLPDLGFTTREDVAEDIRRICSRTALPLLVDADTGFGDIAETVKQFIAAGAAGMHLEDQISQKRCGHRPNKRLVSQQEMVERIQQAVEARSASYDPHFVIMARTDAYDVEGEAGAMVRMQAYIEAGADMLFPEALTSLTHYRNITDQLQVPVLANITEFGRTPLFTTQQLAHSGVAMALYPLTAFRAMSQAALEAYATLRDKGTQQTLIDHIQSREDLYRHLDYHRYEKELDERLDDDTDHH